MFDFVRGVAALLSLLLTVGAPTAQAQIAYDPWADAVQASSGTGVQSPGNAVGPPDGQYTNNVGVQKFITLDMGDGEEGTGPLRIYFGQIRAQSDLDVVFLDRSLAPIKTESSSVGLSVGSQQQIYDFHFADQNKAYRYVRIVSTADLGLTLDAVEALSYIGQTATTDTDGDCVPDRTESTNGTDPQVSNGTCTTPPPPPPPPSGCTADTWSCSEFSSCSAGGLETRTCTMISDCPGVATPSPALSRSCTPPPPPSSGSCQRDAWSCSEWSACSNSRMNRTCTLSFDCPGVSTASPALTSECTSAAVPPSSPGAPSRPAAPAAPGAPASPGVQDTTAPVISGIQVKDLEPTTATIVWTTNEPSDSQVEYGDGTQAFTPLDQQLTTQHEVHLSDLTPGTAYTFRVLSTDAASNQAISPEQHFTTPEPGALSASVGACMQINFLLLVLLGIAASLAAYFYGKTRAPMPVKNGNGNGSRKSR